jgi:MYXO-CTERM domain-containing protein
VGVAGKTSFSFDGPGLTYAVIYGPGYYDVLARYTAIAGGPFMPPLWAFGATWWADDFHQDLRASANAQEHVIDLATQLQTLRIPASALMIDRPYGTGMQGWGNMDFDASFPDPARMVDDLHTRGLELVLWIANRAWNNLYSEGLTQGFLFPGTQALGPAADLRNPAAYAWWRAKLDTLVALGAKGYKIDRGEQGEHPDSVQNENVTLYARLAQEGLAARHGGDAFVFARNVADTGRRHAAIWNGDTNPNFLGLTTSVAAAIRSGMIVMPMWGSDTGGYLRSDTTPTDEVFARWFGFSAYSPMMEVLVGDRHTPWYHHSSQVVDIARAHSATHFDLIPYTRSFMYAATRTGAPVIRPLLFSYPDDPELTNRADEYLYGSELLVAPVLTAGATTRAVYLPAGRWLDYNGRRQVWSGGRTVTLEAPLEVIPVLVREGAIVPRGRLLRGNDNWTPSWSPALRIELFPAENDASRTFDYFTGTAGETITATTAGKKLTVSFGDLGVAGKLDVHVKRAGAVTRNGIRLAPADYQLDLAARLLSVPFTGPTTLVIEDVESVFAPDPPPPDAAGDASAIDGGQPRDDRGCACSTSGRSRAPGLLPLLLALLFRRRHRRAARSASEASSSRAATSASS